MLDGSAAAEVLAAITAADLELPRDRTILAAIAAAHADTGDASPLAVLDVLERRHRVAEVGGSSALLDLATEAADLAGRERIAEHARIVQDAAERRRLVAWAQEMAAAAARGDDLADLRQRWAAAAAQQLEAEAVVTAQDWRQVAGEPPIAWVVDGVLPEKGLLVLAGDPKSGKTLVALDMALRLAHGMDWFGRRARPASTLYVSGEGAGGIPGRLRAWAAAHPSERIAPQQYVAVHRRMPDLGTAAGLGDLRGLLDDLRTRHGRAPDVLVIDTFARAAGSADENDSAAVGAVVDALEALPREYGCAIVILHHLRKASGDRRASRRTLHDLRGSGALAGAIDAVLVAEVTEAGARMIHPAALRDGEEWPPIGYQIIGRPTGRTRPDGRAEVAPVVLPADVAQFAQPDAAAPAPAEAQVDGIVATVRRLGYPVSKETACTTHGGKLATTRAAFDLALGRGLIMRSGGTTRRPLYSAGGVAATPQTPRRDGTGSPAPFPSWDGKGRDGTGRDGIACAEVTV
jgi:replicative DNA helicase